MNSESNQSIIDEPKVASLLIYLLHNQDKYLYATDLKIVINNYSRLSIVLEKLEKKNLISFIKEGKREERRRVELTEKGTQIAKQLDAIVKLENDESDTIESEENFVRDHKESIPDSLNADQKN